MKYKINLNLLYCQIPRQNVEIGTTYEYVSVKMRIKIRQSKKKLPPIFPFDKSVLLNANYKQVQHYCRFMKF